MIIRLFIQVVLQSPILIEFRILLEWVVGIREKHSKNFEIARTYLFTMTYDWTILLSSYIVYYYWNTKHCFYLVYSSTRDSNVSAWIVIITLLLNLMMRRGEDAIFFHSFKCFTFSTSYIITSWLHILFGIGYSGMV